MEIIACEAKRTGKGFIARNQDLIKTLENATADNIKVIDSTIGKRGLLTYLKTLDRTEPIKIIPYKGKFEIEAGNRENIHVEEVEGKGIKIVQGKTRARVKNNAWVKPQGETALLRFNLPKATKSIEVTEWKEAIKKAIACASNEERMIRCIRIEKDGKINVIGCDGFRMVITKIYDGTAIENCNIDKDEAKTMLKTLEKANNVMLVDNAKYVSLLSNNKMVSVKKTDGIYPDWRRIAKNINVIAEAIFDVKDAKEALARVKADNYIRIFVGDGAITLIGDSEDYTAKESIEARTEGKARFAINPKFLKDMFSMEKDICRLYAGNEASAQKFEFGDSTYFVMPMFVEWKGYPV